ncbi:MAG: HlyD family secretion protein [Flavisolibacter sp.]
MESNRNVSNAAQGPENVSRKKNKAFPIILVLLVVGGAWFGITKYSYAQHHAETDDAQISANISPVIPRVSGYVTQVRVSDNQMVKKGDTLLVLDDRDLRIKLEQAEAALGTATSNRHAAEAISNASRTNVTASKAAINTIDAQINAAQVNVWRAHQDYDRYSNLIKDHSVTQQQFDQALAAKETADKQLQVLHEQKAQAAQQTTQVASQSTATSTQINIADNVIKQRQADIDDAKLNLSYAVVISPVDGMVTKVNVQPGQYLQAGQSFFSIVLTQDIWVTANFKETQLDKMKMGQKVILKVDAYPGHEFEGRVGSFSAATGATSSLLPPDNATGNFVKVVQRVPVKIVFVRNDSIVQQLRAGMNVVVDVHLD